MGDRLRLLLHRRAKAVLDEVAHHEGEDENKPQRANAGWCLQEDGYPHSRIHTANGDSHRRYAV